MLNLRYQENFHELKKLILFFYFFAAKYKNEVEVGEALAEAFRSGLVRREEIFMATKVHNFNTVIVSGDCHMCLA